MAKSGWVKNMPEIHMTGGCEHHLSIQLGGNLDIRL